MIKKLYQYKLPLKNGSFREGLLIEEENRWGEIAPLPGWSKETFLEARQEALDCIREEKSPILPSVRFGFSCLQTPLSSLSIPLASLGLQEGFPVAKLKFGSLLLEEAVFLAKQYKDQFDLRLDFNRKWPLEKALAFANHFQPDDFAYLEEPVSSFEELIVFSQKTHMPIALDESIGVDYTQIVSLKAFVVKPTILGEIPFIPPKVQLILSSSYESGLGLLHIAHLSSSPLAIGLDTYRALEQDVLTSPIQCENGRFSWKKKEPLIDFSKLCAL